MVPRSRWLVAVTLLSVPARAEPPSPPPAASLPRAGLLAAGETAPSASELAPAPGQPAPEPAPPPGPSTPEPSPTPEVPSAPEPTPAAPAAPPPSPVPPPALPSTLASPAVQPTSEAAPPGLPPLTALRELAFELGAGVNARLGRAAGYLADQPWGAVYGAGLWLNVANATALGLELVYAELGHGSASNGANLVDAEYSATGLWLGGRFTPWRSEELRFFVALRLGLSLEHVAAYGVRQPSSAFESASVFDCTGTHGPAFGVGGGAGLAFRLNSRLELLGRVDARGERLTSDTVNGCAAGVGSATSMSLGLGLAYGFDGPSGRDEPLARARDDRQTW